MSWIPVLLHMTEDVSKWTYIYIYNYEISTGGKNKMVGKMSHKYE